MESKIISREHIKPCSPTPHHLRIYKISLLDQALAPIHIPVVLYFATESSPHHPSLACQRETLLKQSLSTVLTHFHPLAGRIKDHLSIDCNDDGVPFVVTKVKGTISGFLKEPNVVQLIHGFVPCKVTWYSDAAPGDYVAMVQVNHFECGSIAIGVVFSHMVADGVTISTFLKAWADTTLDCSKEAIIPDYTIQSLYPLEETMQKESRLLFALRQTVRKENSVSRRFVFDTSAISKLKEESGVEGCTRVEAVSAFIWENFIFAACTAKSGKRKPCLITHAVNMRRRAQPPFSEHCFGNFIWSAPTQSCDNETETDLNRVVNKLRESISKIDGGFIKKMQGDEGFSKYCENLQETWRNISMDDTDYIFMTSWCNFGLYRVDFGWGKPVWATSWDGSAPELPLPNMVILMDTRHGDGIEAWVTLDESYMDAFLKFDEVKSFTSIDPCPTELGDKLFMSP